MSRLIQFALTQRVLTILLAVLLAAGGYYAFIQLPIDAFPDVSPTQVKIIIKAPGMTPEEVESRITAPIEIEMLGIPRQTILRSVSKYALADITIDFTEGTDIYWARQQVAERLSGAGGFLPEGISGGMAPMTTPLGEMFMFTIDGELSLTQKRTLLDWTIRPALRTVAGVADVNALGGYVRSFEVVPDIYRMAARGIDPLLLERVLRDNNRNDGAGRLLEGEEALLVRSTDRIRTLEDVEAVVIDVRNGIPITVADVAAVRIGAITRYGAVSQDGKSEAVQGLVLGLRGANARKLVGDVRQKLAQIESALPAGVEINVFYDRSDLVQRAIGTVTRALGEATVLVIVLLVLFLGNLRASVTVALTLPLAALLTFILMRMLDMSANLMSLGGLAIAIGILVDGAVVVVENITTHLARWQGDRRLPRLHVVFRAAREVSVPVASGISIIMIVFVPLLTLQGLEGKLFTPVALTIVFAIGGSLLLSLTIVPVIASLLLRRVHDGEPWLPRKLHELYRPALSWSLGHARSTFVIAGALLMIAAAVFPLIGKSFMPTLDEGDLIVQIEKLPSVSLEESVRLDQRVQAAILAQVPEVTRIVTRVGSDEIGMDPMGLNESDFFMVLRPRAEWQMGDKTQLMEAIRTVLDQFPGLAYGFTQPIEMRVSEMLTGVRGDVAVKLFGPDSATLSELATGIATALEQVDGSADVFTSRNRGVQYLQVTVDRMAAGRWGLDAVSLQRTLRAQLEGLPVGIVQEGIRRTPLLIRTNSVATISPGDFNATPITLPDGQTVQLGQVADIQRVEGVVSIAREQGQRFAVIRVNVSGRDLVGFVEEAKRVLAESVSLPVGYTLEWGGQFENQQRAAARLLVVVPLAIGLIFLLLFTTFSSIRQALLVLANIPFALVGGVFALWVTGQYLSVPASVGFIALLGIAVLNGVVMVAHFNQLRARGMTMADTVVEGAMRRLRPVLMTASIAAFGLVPLLFATGPGSEIQKPLAIVVVGGLFSATVLTLFLLPALYRRFGESEVSA